MTKKEIELVQELVNELIYLNYLNNDSFAKDSQKFKTIDNIEYIKEHLLDNGENVS